MTINIYISFMEKGDFCAFIPSGSRNSLVGGEAESQAKISYNIILSHV